MYRFVLVLVTGGALAGLLGTGSAKAETQHLKVEEGAQKSVALTVYNNNFAVVREVREAVLPIGEFDLEYTDVARDIEPTSVIVASGDRGNHFTILEQNYQYDLLNRKTLLDRFLNRKLKYSRSILSNGSYEKILREGNLLATNPEIVDFGDEIEIAPEGVITLSYVPEELKSVPTLVWRLENRKGGLHPIEVSYITNNVSWRADYTLVLASDESEFDLAGWVTVDNRSGATYPQATLKLVAGDVNRVSDNRSVKYRQAMAFEMARASDMAIPQEESFFEYHLYTMPRKTTLANNETKQLRLMDAAEVNYERGYKLELNLGGNTGVVPQHFDVSLKFNNNERNGLGQPLPAGKVRVYQQDSDGVLQLAGEDNIKHIPKDEEVTLTLGKAFDVVAEQTLLEQRRLGDRGTEFKGEIVVRNHKQDSVAVNLDLKAYGDWVMLEESEQGKKTNAETQTYRLVVPGEGEARLQYRARTTY